MAVERCLEHEAAGYTEDIRQHVPQLDVGILEDLFRRRSREMTQFFAGDIARMDKGFCPVPPDQLEAHKAEARKRHTDWLRMRDYLAARAYSDLKTQQRERWRKALHEIRFSDEWGRLMMAQPFTAQIEQGYSIEISFRGWETTNLSETVFRDIDWPATLDRFKGTRNEGKTESAWNYSK
jgi:hypothetical protein